MPLLKKVVVIYGKSQPIFSGMSVPVVLYAGHVSRLHELNARATRKAKATIRLTFFMF